MKIWQLIVLLLTITLSFVGSAQAQAQEWHNFYVFPVSAGNAETCEDPDVGCGIIDVFGPVWRGYPGTVHFATAEYTWPSEAECEWCYGIYAKHLEGNGSVIRFDRWLRLADQSNVKSLSLLGVGTGAGLSLGDGSKLEQVLVKTPAYAVQINGEEGVEVKSSIIVAEVPLWLAGANATFTNVTLISTSTTQPVIGWGQYAESQVLFKNTLARGGKCLFERLWVGAKMPTDQELGRLLYDGTCYAFWGADEFPFPETILHAPQPLDDRWRPLPVARFYAPAFRAGVKSSVEKDFYGVAWSEPNRPELGAVGYHGIVQGPVLPMIFKN